MQQKRPAKRPGIRAELNQAVNRALCRLHNPAFDRTVILLRAPAICGVPANPPAGERCWW